MANLYEEYKLFCDEKNIPVPYETRIKKYEFIQNDCPLIFVENKERNPYIFDSKKEEGSQSKSSAMKIEK